ncbi:MAG: ATP-binding protein, partial [Bacteroidia bacterium]|nr:ATP-binding protein [Bacteroidia bacterium]
FFLLIIIGFEDSFEKIKARFTLENIQADFIILVFVIVSIQISNYVLSLLDPGINAFIGDPLSKAWIFLNVFLPIGISFVLSFLFTTKFSKSVTTDKRFRSKFIFAAISAPILSDIFYMNYAKFIFDFNLDFIALPLIVLLLLPARLIGNLWYKYANKGEISRWYVFSVFLLIVNYYYSMIYFEEHSSNFYIALIMWIPLTGISYISSRSKNNIDSVIDEEQLNSLTNPRQYIRKGLNIDSMEKEIIAFIDSDIDILSIVDGGSGIGKTRFFREFKKRNQDYEVFIGDFDEFKEGVIQLYEPFFQAFCLHDNMNYQIEKGFFSDRSVTFNSLKKVATIASKAGPIDLGEIISIDDNDGLSVNEISGELIELLVDRAKINKDDDKKFVLILDDYQWVDSATNELLLNFIEKVKNRGSLSRKFKIILSVSDLELNLKNHDIIFNDSFKKVEDLIGDENIRNFQLKATESKDFLDALFDEKGYAYFSDDSDGSDNRNVVFSPNLKAHLSDVVRSNAGRFKPGNLFNYFQALKNFNLLGIEGNLFRLIREPGEDFTFEDSEQILMKSKFDALSDEYKKLIESASHIGFKFDASIVAHIWKLDLIHVINILESIEALGLVEDDPSLDNVFVFTNKNFHKWLRSNHGKENSNEFRQKIIEFQKRIINSVLSKGDEYIDNLDIDILKSISNRCNLFLNIDEIERSALKFNLLTAGKLTSLNKLSQASEYLGKAAHSFKYLDESQIKSLFNIIENYQQIDKTLNQLEVLITRDNQKNLVLLDEIFDVLLKRTDITLRSKLVLIFLLDAYRNKREVDRIENDVSRSIIEESKIQRFKKVFDILPFIIEKDRLRGDFYKTLISNPSDIVTLSALKKSSITSSDFNLASEISRHLAFCLKSKETVDQMFIHVVDSLYIEASREEDIKLLNYSEIDAGQIIQIVRNLLSNTSISFQKASDLSYTISRIIEVLFFKEDYINLLEVAKLGESLNKRIGDNFGLYIIWSYSGASNLILENIQEAEESYKSHFYTLIK